MNWTCLRCGDEKEPEQRIALSFFGVEGFNPPAGLPVCSTCATVIRTCLEHAVRLTPICVKVGVKRVVWTCNEGPCSCRQTFRTRTLLEKHQFQKLRQLNLFPDSPPPKR